MESLTGLASELLARHGPWPLLAFTLLGLLVWQDYRAAQRERARETERMRNWRTLTQLVAALRQLRETIREIDRRSR